MKKTILLLITITSLLSCQKQADVLLPSLTSDAKREYLVTDDTIPYSDRLFNTCLNEWVYLTGTARYQLKESYDNGFYIDYTIKVDATGISEITGTQFHGGGSYTGIVKQNLEGDDEWAKVSYNIKYMAAGGNKMGYLQHAKYVVHDGIVKVEFNDETPTCE